MTVNGYFFITEEFVENTKRIVSKMTNEGLIDSLISAQDSYNSAYKNDWEEHVEKWGVRINEIKAEMIRRMAK